VLALNATTLEVLNRDAPEPLVRRRVAGFDIYQETPPPSDTEEAWRYVEIDVDFDALALAERAGDPLAPGPFVSAITDAVGHAVVVDGHAVTVDGGESVGLTAAATLWLEGEAPRLVDPSVDKFAAAGFAFGGDGAALRVPAGVVEPRPVVIELQAATGGTISFPEVVVEVGENADVNVVVVYRSPNDVDAVIAPLLGLDVAPGGRLRFTTVQLLGDATTLVAHERARLDRDATLRVGEAGLGGALARLDLGVRLDGDGSSVEVVGLYFGEARQVLDYRMVIDHVGRSTSSDVLLKGAVEDEAQSVFTGLLRIAPSAARTSAFETNRNLVLSEGAKAHSVPNLEILCDDVVCGHGSSVGPLDAEHLYYLMSRGLSRPRAERLLVHGFFEEVIERLPSKAMAEPLRREVDDRFAAAQAAGRLG